MNSVSPEFQVAFIRYIQRLMVEGGFIATYKFALLHALADICIEQPIKNGSQISLDEITEKFIELYWQHSLPFKVDNTEAFVFLQNTGKQAAIISSLFDIRQTGIQSAHQLKQSSHWPNLISRSKRTIKEGPLWRLQILSGSVEAFLYKHDKQSKYLILNDGVAACFRQYYELIISILRSHWLDRIRSMPANQSALGNDSDLSEFLFGGRRNALAKVKPVFEEIQKGRCFYCEKPLKNRKAEVDHFIPWAKYPSDLAHNFLLACHKCNNNKSDHLAAKPHYEKWHLQNIQDHALGIDSELREYFYSDVMRSESISNWAYEGSRMNNSRFWVSVGEYAGYYGLSVEVVE